MRNSCTLMTLALVGLAGPVRLLAAADGKTVDENLRLARAFVARSDRYMDYSQLRPGMTGYGLTVLAGTRIEKFDATVISVLHNWYPHQAVILCKLGGLGLEQTGIISGMSGSPVFIKDPADGKHKLIGALAYGWWFQKEPVCGIQPIAQMLAVEGVPLPGRKPAKKQAAARPAGTELDEDFVQAVLNPRKVSFAAFGLPERLQARRPAGDALRMAPLQTPVMVAGVSGRTLQLAEEVFAGTGLVPLQAGTVGQTEAAAAKDAKLQPGASLSVPLVTGDAEWSAIGTVTDVLGDYVLGFGHSFMAMGAVELPIGPAYVHAVVSSSQRSFKLGSTLGITGAATTDEYTGVGGRIGGKAGMVPMTVTVRWGQAEQKFNYRLARHNWLTAAMASMMMRESLWANRDLPDRHTIEYAVDIQFEKYGRYRAANLSSASGSGDVGSDLTRPLAAMMNAHLGQPVFPKSLDVKMTVRRVQQTAEILGLDLERHAYKPGQTVRGKVTLRPFRAPRTTVDVALELPEDLPDGSYTLRVSDGAGLLRSRQAEMPHRFEPRTVEQLFRAVQEVVEPRMDRLYVSMQLPGGGVAVKKDELEHLPGSWADILGRAAPRDTSPYKRSKTVEFKTQYVMGGSASAGFTVQKEPHRNH